MSSKAPSAALIGAGDRNEHKAAMFSRGDATEDSDDSESEDEMDEFGNYTVADSSDSDIDEESDDDQEDDDDESIDSEADPNFEVSSIKGSIKSAVSDVSGSFDDDEKLGLLDMIVEDIEQDPNDMDGKKKEAKDLAAKKKNKKRVFKLGTGLGRKKTESKTVKTEAVTKKTKTKRGKKVQVKSTTMKQTVMHAQKSKMIKKKQGVQLRTIRINGQLDQDDIVPRKGDPGVKGKYTIGQLCVPSLCRNIPFPNSMLIMYAQSCGFVN